MVQPYVLSSKVLTSCYSSCTQEKVCWAKKAICKEWGKTFWSYPGVNWSFLSSTISYSNVNSRWSSLPSLSTLATCLNRKQSLTTFGKFSPANMITAPPALLRGKQKHIFGIIIFSHNQWNVLILLRAAISIVYYRKKTSLNNLNSHKRNKE